MILGTGSKIQNMTNISKRTVTKVQSHSSLTDFGGLSHIAVNCLD